MKSPVRGLQKKSYCGPARYRSPVIHVYLIMAKQGMVTLSEMTVSRPGEGVRPPSERAEQTSSLLAPPRAALKADSTLSTHTWTNIYHVSQLLFENFFFFYILDFTNNFKFSTFFQNLNHFNVELTSIFPLSSHSFDKLQHDINKVEVDTGSICNTLALVRWQSPKVLTFCA